MSAADIRSWGRDVRAFADDAPGRAIELVDRAIVARLRADTGGDGALSRGRKLGRATTTTTTRKGEAIVEPSGSRAVWGILQGGTTAHVIRAAPGRFLATPKGPRRQVRIPATSARHTFTEGATRGMTDAERQLSNEWGRL
jgi:hypothetical protein